MLHDTGDIADVIKVIEFRRMNPGLSEWSNLLTQTFKSRKLFLVEVREMLQKRQRDSVLERYSTHQQWRGPCGKHEKECEKPLGVKTAHLPPAFLSGQPARKWDLNSTASTNSLNELGSRFFPRVPSLAVSVISALRG